MQGASDKKIVKRLANEWFPLVLLGFVLAGSFYLFQPSLGGIPDLEEAVRPSPYADHPGYYDAMALQKASH